jgi:hypothetical protein
VVRGGGDSQLQVIDALVDSHRAPLSNHRAGLLEILFDVT